MNGGSSRKRTLRGPSRADRWTRAARAFLVLILPALVGLAAAPAVAQQSASFNITDQTFNSGGHPAAGQTLTSASFHVTLDSLGESVVGRSLASSSFRMDASFVSGYPPPGEIRGLRFASKTDLAWDADPAAGDYDLYRDTLSLLASGDPADCLQANLPQPSATDGSTPAASAGWYYLVTCENRLDEEGSPGWSTGGDERGTAACP